MGLATLLNRAKRLETQAKARRRPTAPAGTAPATTLQKIAQDPAAVLSRAGLSPDPWQATFLRSGRSRDLRALLNCSRQSGKSLTAAGLALATALLEPGALVLLLSPTLRQSGELFRSKVLYLASLLRWPVAPKRLTATELELVNGSRIVSLPESESGIRCFSAVRLLVIDEAARVSDDMVKAVRPMMATSGGGLVGLSTPFGQRGWFYESFDGKKGATSDRWRRVKITADECPRITPEFLSEEEAELGEAWFRQEYYCEFRELVGACFSAEQIAAAFRADVLPLFPPFPARA